MLKAVPALGARDLGLTLTLDAMWPEGLGGLEAASEWLAQTNNGSQERQKKPDYWQE